MSRCGIYDEKLGFLPEDDFLKEAKPQTHYDLLIRKTPEELAGFMADTGQGCPPGEDLSECCFGKPEPPSKKNCAKCWLDWLKQEA